MTELLLLLALLLLAPPALAWWPCGCQTGCGCCEYSEVWVTFGAAGVFSNNTCDECDELNGQTFILTPHDPPEEPCNFSADRIRCQWKYEDADRCHGFEIFVTIVSPTVHGYFDDDIEVYIDVRFQGATGALVVRNNEWSVVRTPCPCSGLGINSTVAYLRCLETEIVCNVIQANLTQIRFVA